MKPTILTQVETHGQRLINLFGSKKDAVTLCRTLRRLEVRASRINESYANGDVTSDWHDEEQIKLQNSVVALFNSPEFTDAFYYNSDPRGYALKLHDWWVRKHDNGLFRDWGGYGILAPEFK